MTLIKSTSKAAFGHNIGAELRAGKPKAQAVAIAYAEKRAAAHKHKEHPHHSDHSSNRSEHYHTHVAGDQVRPVEVLHEFGATTKMHKSEHAPQSAEDTTEKGHKL